MLEADILAALFDEDQALERRVPVNPYKELRYLVIEDQEASRKTLQMCIQSMGGTSIDLAATVNDAVHRIQRHMPDVIVCDYILGSGRTGQQLLEDLRRSRRLPHTVAFLMVTAERTYEQVVSAVELAPDDYIIKPFSPETLRTRMERAIRKKLFFHEFHGKNVAGDCVAALAELDALEGTEEARQYRFDILRARAETLLAAESFQQAHDCYAAILETYPFPWAQAGHARALRHLARYEEAEQAVDSVLAAAPTYFDAYDLKADICCDLGKFDAAQAILTQVAERTPRNWQRKRNLSGVAKLNGDFETSRKVIEEVIANDHVGGVTIGDRIALVRTALESGDHALAQQTLGELAPAAREALGTEDWLNLECLEAQLEGEAAGARRFDRVRAELRRARLPVECALDAIRAALTFSDRQLADHLADDLLTGREARRSFHAMLDIYRQHGIEEHFRQLQRTAAARLLQKKA